LRDVGRRHQLGSADQLIGVVAVVEVVGLALKAAYPATDHRGSALLEVEPLGDLSGGVTIDIDRLGWLSALRCARS